jgi:lipoprotein-releasing system permease protein
MPLMESGYFPFPIIVDMRLLFLLSRRYAFSRQNRHRGTSVRIAMGFALCIFAIIAVLSFMQALQRDQFADIRTFESFDLQLPLPHNDIAKADSIIASIEALDSVQAAFLYADLPVIVQALDGTTVAGRIRAIEPKGRFSEQLNAYRGNLFEDGTLAVSYSHSRSMQLDDEISVTMLKKGRQATVIPSQREMPVGSLYYTTSYTFDQSTFLCSIATLLSLNAEAELHIGIFTSAGVDQVKQEIERLGFSSVATWREVNASLYGAMELEQKMMTLMLFLMVIVVLVHIKSSSRRLLLAKQREIAMLRSMGLTIGRVRLIFLLQSFLVALLGCLIGVVLSYAAVGSYPSLSQLVYRSMGVHLVLEIRPTQVIWLVVSILLFSLVASFQGTHRIMKADIMEMFGHDEVR